MADNNKKTHTQNIIEQTDAIISILSNDNVNSTIKFAPNNAQIQDEDSIGNTDSNSDTPEIIPNDFSFDFKRFKFNNKPTFLIYMIVTCVSLSQGILSGASFLELQLNKINNHSIQAKTTNEYLSYMKWTGLVFTSLQLFSVYFFGCVLDKRGVRFAALFYMVCFFGSNCINLYLMSDYYNFEFYSYIFFRLIAIMDGGYVVLITIINAGITDLFDSHTKRMLHFNYLYSIVGIFTFVVPFFTTFVIKRFGNYATLQIEAVSSILNIVFVYMFLNDLPKSSSEKVDNETTKNPIKTTNSIKPINTVLSKAEAIAKKSNIIMNILKQFEVFVLPKSTGIARKNVLLIESYNILSTMSPATIMVGISYLMVNYNFNSVQLNYITSFFGCYGCVTSFLGIKLFYVIINNFTSLKPSSFFFDRIDKIQLLINSAVPVVAFTFPLIFRKSWIGQFFMLMCFETFVFVGPIVTNGIIKIIENENEYKKLNADEENDLLLSTVDDAVEVIQETKPAKSKTAIIYSCFTIQDKVFTAVYSAVLFQVMEMTKDTRPWLFYVISLTFASINFIISTCVQPIDSKDE